MGLFRVIYKANAILSRVISYIFMYRVRCVYVHSTLYLYKSQIAHGFGCWRSRRHSKNSSTPQLFMRRIHTFFIIQVAHLCLV